MASRRYPVVLVLAHPAAQSARGGTTLQPLSTETMTRTEQEMYRGALRSIRRADPPGPAVVLRDFLWKTPKTKALDSSKD